MSLKKQSAPRGRRPGGRGGGGCNHDASSTTIISRKSFTMESNKQPTTFGPRVSLFASFYNRVGR